MSEIWVLNLVLAVLGLDFFIQMFYFEFVKLSFWCLVSEFSVLNYKFIFHAVVSLSFSNQRFISSLPN